MFGVVGAQLDAAGARQRAALAADLGPGHVGQHRLSVGGGEELDDVSGRERLDDTLPQPGRHAGADEQAHRVVAVQDEGRIGRVVEDLAEHGPGVGHHGDAVLAHLLDESGPVQSARQRDAGAADHRAAQADQQRGLVVQRRQAVHGVAAVEGGRRGRTERRDRPAVVGDLLGHQLAAGRAERDERQVPGQSRVGPIPAGQLDGVRVDLFHVDDLGLLVGVLGQVQVPRLAAAEHQHLPQQLPVRLQHRVEVGGVGEDLGHSPEPHRGGQVGVGPHHHRDGAQAGQRGDGHQRAGPGLHQHADPVALAHPDLDEAADDVVDAPVHRLVGMHPPVEQQEFALRGVVRLLLDDAAQRDPGVVVDLPQPDQSWQRAGRFDGQGAHGFVGRDDGVGRAADHAQRRLGGLPDAVREPGAQRHAAVGVLGGLVGHRRDAGGLIAAGGQPSHPFRDGRPALLGRLGPDDQAEMARADGGFVDVGVRCRAPDAAHRGRLADVVDLADEGQHRAGDVGQGDHLSVDGETPGHHPVVGDELLEQLGDRGTGPRDPAFAFEEAPLLLARQQRLAVVQLADEVDPRLGGLEGVEHLEAGARHPAGDGQPAEDVVGHEVGGGRGEVCRDAHRQGGQGVDRGAEGDDAGQALRTPVGGDLVTPHAALRIADQMDVAARGVPDRVDGLTERDDVIGQRAAHAAFDLVGFAEVDDPGIEPPAVQDPHRAFVAGDVPHVGGHHHRMHHQHRRPDGRLAGPTVRREVPPELVHRHALDDLGRRRHRAGFQAPQSQDFQPVLRGSDQPRDRSCDHRKIDIHCCSLSLDSLDIMAHLGS